MTRPFRLVLDACQKQVVQTGCHRPWWGVCESIMYLTAFLVGKPEFIGIWLALKVAGQWVRWKGEAPRRFFARRHNAEEANEGRRRFNAFLIGNVSSAKVIPHSESHGYYPLFPEGVVSYCRVLGPSFFL